MSKRTRREFLEDALFTAAIAATAGGARKVWAEPASVKPVGPNDKVRLAVIGVHGRGREHLRGFTQLPDVTVAAICDIDLTAAVIPGALQTVTRAGRPEPKVVQDLRRIMDDPEIDAVSIATPNHWHALAAIWAMQAGKDVYVEKPASHNVHE